MEGAAETVKKDTFACCCLHNSIQEFDVAPDLVDDDREQIRESLFTVSLIKEYPNREFK